MRGRSCTLRVTNREGITIKILFLTQICPYPPTNGGAIKSYNILKHLCSKHEVTLLTFVRSDKELKSLAHLSQYCRRVDSCLIKRSKLLNVYNAIRSLTAWRSFIIARDGCPGMQLRVFELLRENPDLIYVDHLQMLQFIPRSVSCPVLLDDHNVEWRIIERFAEASTSWTQSLFARIEWPRLKSYELRACSRADVVLTVTPQDRDTLVSNGIPSGKVKSLPIGVDTEYFQPLSQSPDSKRILTFGTMAWPPNADAVSYFVKEVYPLIKQRVPDAQFSIVGANPPPEIQELGMADKSIEVAGFVDDIRKAAEDAAVFVVPLRVGSGMRVKILDAMAMRLPIVTTSIGYEGIGLTPGEHALVADTPTEFADAVTRLLTDAQERQRIGSAGRKLVESAYSWPLILRSLDDIISHIGH